MSKSYYLSLRGERGGVYYVRYRIPRGANAALGSEILPWRSTGQTDRALAEQWAASHKPTLPGKIVPGERLTFGAFAKGWFEPGHDYVIRQAARGYALSPLYLDELKWNLERHILPQFKKWKLALITPADIDDWLFKMKDGKPNAYPPIKGLSASTINHALVTLREMLSHAAFSGLIPSNPAEKVHRLAERHKARGILSFPEVKKLLAEATINEVWSGNQVHYAINLLAASTGMRVGEIRGLQRQHVHLEVEPWIEVAHGWRGKYGLGDPKCLSFREIPLTTMVAKWMGIVMARSPYQAPDALVFFGDVERRRKRGLVPTDGLTPITHKWIQKKFYEALSKIDIDAASRGIVFHSWRHWFVSAIRSSQSLPDHLLRRLSGHKSNAIEAYTHVSRQEFAPVAEVFGKVME